MPHDTLRTVMRVHSITDFGAGITVNLAAAPSADPDHPNRAISDRPPAASATVTIQANKDAAGHFRVGREYFVDFSPAD